MTRARTDMTEVEADLSANLKTIRETLQPDDGSDIDTAVCGVETFCAIALRVLKKTNPSKVRSESLTFEIKARIDGVPVVKGIQ